MSRIRKKPALKNAVKTIRVTSKLNTIDDEEIYEELDVEDFVVDPAFVRASAGVTKSLKQYESLRVDVSVTLPCYKEDILRAHGVAADMVSTLLDEELSRYLNEDL